MVRRSKTTWLVIILIVLLLLTVIYIGIGEYKKHKERLELEAYQQGMEDVISDMYGTGKECRLIALDAGDGNHIKLISIDCLEEKEE